MKNLSKETVNHYNILVNSACKNDEFNEEKEKILKFFVTTKLHLEMDSKDIDKVRIKKLDRYKPVYKELLETTNKLIATVMNGNCISSFEINDIDTLNSYNEVKNRQIKRIAIASVLLTIIAIVFMFV